MGGIGSGGARDGAGRKTIDGAPRTKLSISLPTELLIELRDVAGRRQISVSQHITDLITKGLNQ